MANKKTGAAAICPTFCLQTTRSANCKHHLFAADNTISKQQATLLVLVSGIQHTFSQLEKDAKQLFANVISSLEGRFDILGYSCIGRSVSSFVNINYPVSKKLHRPSPVALKFNRTPSTVSSKQRPVRPSAVFS